MVGIAPRAVETFRVMVIFTPRDVNVRDFPPSTVLLHVQRSGVYDDFPRVTAQIVGPGSGLFAELSVARSPGIPQTCVGLPCVPWPGPLLRRGFFLIAVRQLTAFKGLISLSLLKHPLTGLSKVTKR